MDKKMVSGLAVAAALAGVGSGKTYANSKEEDSLVMSQAGQGEVEAMKAQLEQMSTSVAKAKDLVATDQSAYDATLAELGKQEGLLTEAQHALTEAQKAYDLANAELIKQQEKNQQATPERMVQLRSELESVKATAMALQDSASKATAEAIANAQSLESKKEELATLNRQKAVAESELPSLKQALSEQEAAVAALEEPNIISYLPVAKQGVENARQLVEAAEKRLAVAKETDGTKVNDLAVAQLALDTATKALDVATSEYLTAQQAVTRARETVAALEGTATVNQPPKVPVLPIVRPSELEVPDGDHAFVSVLGHFATPLKELILNRINAIRQEAYQSGLVDHYVPMKWSKSLEEMAMTRVAETYITRAHKRLTDKDWSSVEDPYPFEMWEESIGYTTAAKEQAFLETIEQFYREKGANYQALVNPEYTHIGMAAFQLSDAKDTTAVLQLFANEASLDEAVVGHYGEMYQQLEADFADISNIGLESSQETLQVGKDILALTLTGTLSSKYKEGTAPISVPVSLLSGVSWRSTDPTVAVVDDKGIVTPLKPGTVSIRAIYRGLAYAKTLVVKEPITLAKAQEVLIKAEADVRTTEQKYQRAQAALETAKSSYENMTARELLTPAAQQQYENSKAELEKALEIEQKISQVSALFDKEKAAKKASLDAVRAKVAAKENEIETLTAKAKVDAEALIGYEVNLASFQSRVAVRQAELTAINERLSALRQSLADLEASGNQLQETERVLQKAQASLKQQQAAVTAITGKVTTLRAQSTILQNKLTEAQKALAEAQKQEAALQQRYVALLKDQVKTEELVKQYHAILDKGGLPVPVYDETGQITGYVDKASSSADSGTTTKPASQQNVSTAPQSTAVISQLPTASSPVSSSDSSQELVADTLAPGLSEDTTGKPGDSASVLRSRSLYQGAASGVLYGSLPKTADQSTDIAAIAGAVVTTVALTAIKRRKKETGE